MAAFAFPVAVIAATPLVAVDLAYLIRAGEIMLDSHHVLRTDPFLAWTIGRPWLNQQWGAEVVVAVAYRMLGWLGLALLRALLESGVLLGVFLAARAAGADRRRAALLTLMSSILAFDRFLLRAQLFGMVCFGLCLWLIAGRRDNPRRVWWVAALTVIWANLHGSFFLAPLLLGLAWIEDLSRHDRAARRTLVVLAVTCAATVFSPFGPAVWSYVKDVSTNNQVVNAIVEWQPTALNKVPGLVFFVSVALVAGYFARSLRSVPWTSLLRLAVFFFIGLATLRGTTWWALLLPVELATLLPQRETARPDPALKANWVAVGVLAVAVVASLIRWLPHANEDNPGSLLTYAPAGITRELGQVLVPGRPFFNDQGWGSWFELALPRNPVVADSRFEVIPSNRWEQFVSVSRGRQGWQEILDAWGVDVVAVSRHHPEYLIPLMRQDPGWHLAYEDADGVVFVRT